jgi:hypothetical protein
VASARLGLAHYCDHHDLFTYTPPDLPPSRSPAPGSTSTQRDLHVALPGLRIATTRAAGRSLDGRRRSGCGPEALRAADASPTPAVYACARRIRPADIPEPPAAPPPRPGRSSWLRLRTVSPHLAPAHFVRPVPSPQVFLVGEGARLGESR